MDGTVRRILLWLAFRRYWRSQMAPIEPPPLRFFLRQAARRTAKYMLWAAAYLFPVVYLPQLMAALPPVVTM